MKPLLPVLSACLMASNSPAGLDPDTDSFGVCFDTAGNTNCATVAALQPITAYLLLMNPVGPTDGFECTVAMTGAPHVILSTKLLQLDDLRRRTLRPVQLRHRLRDGLPVVTGDGVQRLCRGLPVRRAVNALRPGVQVTAGLAPAQVAQRAPAR